MIGRRVLAATLLGGAAPATRMVMTPQGATTIPVVPQRVVAIDSRSNLEPALLLGLPVIGYSHSPARPWVPVPPATRMLRAPPDLEQILALRPDLVICTEGIPDSPWWPLERLRRLAPVLPTDYRMGWQDNLTRLAGWLGREAVGAQAIATHAAGIAAIRQRHATAIARARVVAVQLDPVRRVVNLRAPGTLYGQVMPGQVLAELGGRTVEAAQLPPDGALGLEALGAALGEIDGLLVIDGRPAVLEAFAREPLWRRLPAVRSGRLQLLPGNSVFGSYYTAGYLAAGWEQLYARLD